MIINFDRYLGFFLRQNTKQGCGVVAEELQEHKCNLLNLQSEIECLIKEGMILAPIKTIKNKTRTSRVSGTKNVFKIKSDFA